MSILGEAGYGAPADLGPWVPLHTLRPTGLGGAVRGAQFTKDVAAVLTQRCQAVLPRPITIAVVSLKGGSSKSYVTMGVSTALFTERRQMIAVIDADSDAGTTNRQFGGGDGRTWLRMLSAAAKDPQVRRQIQRDPSPWAATRVRPPAGGGAGQSRVAGMDIFASPADPVERQQVMAPRHLPNVWRLLGMHYWVRVVDTSTDLADHTGMGRGGIESADAVIIATSTAEDDLRLAQETRDLLSRQGFDRLARTATVAVWMRPRDRKPESHSEAEDRIRVGYLNGHAELGRVGSGRFADLSVQEIIAVPHDRATTGGGQVYVSHAGEPVRAAFRAVAASAVTAALTGLR